MVRETLVTSVNALSNRADLVKENSTPNVTILHVVQTIVTSGHKAVNYPWVSDFAMLAPVAGELQLGLLW